MGAWSTRIFDDDGASDIRAEYRIMLGYGISNEEVYKRIEAYFYKDYKGSDDEDVYWLSIALFQWQNGMLLNEVKENALRCIDKGSYIERWKESGKKTYEKRREVLQTLKNKLLYEENPVKKIGKCPAYYRSKTKWKVGDLLAYRILEDMSLLYNNNREMDIKKEESFQKLWGKYVLLRVVENGQRPVTSLYPELDYTSWSNLMLYDWIGDTIPSEEELNGIPFRKIVASRFSKGVCRMVTAVSLEWERKDEAYAEIQYLSNNSSYNENLPDLYKENPGSPCEYAQSFNRCLVETFADIQDKEVIWEYRD